MIDSRKAYKEYLAEDKKALNRTLPFPLPIDYTWRFQRLLRKSEYYLNCKRGPLGRCISLLLRVRVRSFGMKYGFSIPENVFGKGLSIAHVGTIVVNPAARVGNYCGSMWVSTSAPPQVMPTNLPKSVTMSTSLPV